MPLLKQNWFIGCMVFVLVFIISGQVVSAHPGRTDALGCHTCRTNCTSWGLSYGEYHCHRAKSLTQPKEPIKSTFGPSGTGTTQPAPEYKNPSTITPKNTSESKTVTNKIAEQQPGGGFWQWFTGLFK